MLRRTWQLLPPERQRFFASHTMTQLAIWSHTATALGNLSAATRAVASKDYRGAAAQANAAVGEMEALLAAERAGEGGVWAAWHLYHSSLLSRSAGHCSVSLIRNGSL